MADSMIASAVALPEDKTPDDTAHPNGVKRRLSDSAGEEKEEQESKRQRVSPGKNSPTAARDGDDSSNRPTTDAEVQEKTTDPREARRKSTITDDKQRSKRLFGALLGNLNQPRDRTARRREEIESRKKAELQRQDDKRIEEKERRQEKLAEQRKKAQVKVEEEAMRIRHSNMLNSANYLQTLAEPKIFYRPWDLRPDEEDRIDDQIRDAQAQIDKELDEFDEAHGRENVLRNAADFPVPVEANGDSKTAPSVTNEDDNAHLNSKMADEGDQALAKSANKTDTPAEVPESPTDVKTNPTSSQNEQMRTEPQEGKMEEMEDDGEHVEGDEDAVIY